MIQEQAISFSLDLQNDRAVKLPRFKALRTTLINKTRDATFYIGGTRKEDLPRVNRGILLVPGGMWTTDMQNIYYTDKIAIISDKPDKSVECVVYV